MNETSPRRQHSPLLYLYLLLFGSAVLNSALFLIRAAVANATVILILYYVCSLLSLLTTMLGMGAALLYLANRNGKAACAMVLLTSAAGLLPLLTAAIRTGLLYEDAATAITLECLTALGNALIMAALHLLLLLLCHLLFFRRKAPLQAPVSFSPLRNRLGHANLLVVLLLMLYQLIYQTVDVVDFLINDRLGIPTNADIAMKLIEKLLISPK